MTSTDLVEIVNLNAKDVQGRSWTGGNSVTVKASNSNKIQLLSTNGPQQLQYQCLETGDFNRVQ
jgi:hypothetical protein